MVKYERKLLKFWIQSFLLGVPKIVVGFRDRNGGLQRLEELETRSLPTFVKRQGRGAWDGNICINFTASFLACEWSNVLDSEIWLRLIRAKADDCRRRRLENTTKRKIAGDRSLQERGIRVRRHTLARVCRISHP